MKRGTNLPGFVDVQLEFAAHIRNPDLHPAPGDIEPRRMKIYRDLFYNNIQNFLASGFPVAKKVLGSDAWHRLVRSFIHLNPSETPYFLEISQEFLAFLGSRTDEDLPPFLLELCHYEWVELALSVNDTDLPEEGIDPDGDLLAGTPVVSPLIWCLAYRWPVHEIGPEHVPQEPPPQPTELIVYRQRNDDVKFMVVNPVTLRLVELLQQDRTGAEALEALAAELEHIESGVVHQQGAATMERLRHADILLGTRIGTTEPA
jgi:hypothetical protein